MHNAVELALLILPTTWKWNEDTTSISERTNRRACGVPCVKQGAVEGNTSSHTAKH
jgi:hypothetical protein